MALICTEVSAQDIREKPMWIVNLNNGVTVYQSDDNPSLEDRNSWLCLKKVRRGKSIIYQRYGGAIQGPYRNGWARCKGVLFCPLNPW